MKGATSVLLGVKGLKHVLCLRKVVQLIVLPIVGLLLLFRRGFCAQGGLARPPPEVLPLDVPAEGHQGRVAPDDGGQRVIRQGRGEQREEMPEHHRVQLCGAGGGGGKGGYKYIDIL